MKPNKVLWNNKFYKSLSRLINRKEQMTKIRTSLPTSQTWDGWQSGPRNNCAPFLTPQMQQTKQLKTTKTQKQFFCHDQRTWIHSLRSAIARAREFHQRILSHVYRRNTSVQHHLFRKMGESALSKACGAGGRITPTAKPETRKVRDMDAQLPTGVPANQTLQSVNRVRHQN